MKWLDDWRKWRLVSKNFKKLISESPEIIDALVNMAEKTAKEAVLQKLFDETQSKDMNAMLFRKLAETSREGIVIQVKMNNADVTFRKEDVYDDMARHRLNQMLREGSLAESTISSRTDLTIERFK